MDSQSSPLTLSESVSLSPIDLKGRVMTDSPRILTLDIETVPARVWRFDLFDKAPTTIDKVIEPGRTIGLGAKWLERPRVQWYSDFHHGHDIMVTKAWNLLNEADIVVHYNGTSFDIPHLRTEFVLAGFPPPSPFREIDLYKVIRKQFNFLSNKLDFISQQLEIGAKVKHEGFALWRSVMEDDPKAWARMRRYCMGDTKLAEALYLRIRPWITNHPHIGLYTDDASMTCPNCGSGDGQWRGYAYTPQSKYRQWWCRQCGKWSRAVKRELGADLRSVS